MLRWAPFPFLRFTFFLGAGILSYLFTGRMPEYIPWLLALGAAGFLLLLFLAHFKKSSSLTDLAGLTGLGLLFISGFMLTHYRTARHQPDNLIHHSGTVSYYVGVVDDYLVRKPTSVSTTLRLKGVKTNGQWRPASGQVRLTLKNESTAAPFAYGDILLIKGAPALVKPPLNPGQFNFQKYLANRQVYHQHYLPFPQFKILGSEPAFALIDKSIRVRNHLDARLRRYLPSEREYAVAAALLLGIRDNLPDDVKANFSRSGTMHVLAVSGLHVGVLFWIINLLLGKWSKRRGLKLLRFLFLLCFFGFYAFVTALSPSVLRAVVMFIFLATADTFRRQTNIYNTLAATAFFLLLINPYYLVEVGFQLSFLALLGIIYFTPKIQNLYSPGTYVGTKVWQMLSATVAAQITTLPLTFYYFHQFPVYFLAANLVAITLALVALSLGLLVLALAWLPPVAEVLGAGLQNVIWLMNEANAWLLQAPLPVVGGIGLTARQTWLLYALLVLLVLFLVRKKLIFFGLFTGLVLIFCGLKIAEAMARNQSQCWVIYHTPRATALGFVTGDKINLIGDSAFYHHAGHQRYILQPHLQQAGLTAQSTDTLKTNPAVKNIVPVQLLPDGNWLVQRQRLKVAIIRQKPNLEQLAIIQPQYILLTQNAYFAVNSLPASLKETKVILGSANGYRYQQRLEQELTKAGLICYNINQKGAFVSRLPAGK